MTKFRPPTRIAAPIPLASSPATVSAAAAVFDCLYWRGKKAAKDGTLVLQGRSISLFDLTLVQVQTDSLDSDTAQQLQRAHQAAVSQPGAALWDEPPSIRVGQLSVEVENQTTAALSAEEWTLRQQVQQQVKLHQMVGSGTHGLGASQGVQVFGERKTRFKRATQGSEQ
ncbi:hypothetical protein N2152v2_008911 [Parachlorella kessleri]